MRARRDGPSCGRPVVALRAPRIELQRQLRRPGRLPWVTEDDPGLGTKVGTTAPIVQSSIYLLFLAGNAWPMSPNASSLIGRRVIAIYLIGDTG